MHNCHQGIAEHFLLSKGEEDQISPAFGGVVAEVFGFAQKNIAADDADVFCKEPDGERGEGYKKYLLYDLHMKVCAAKINISHELH